MCNIRSQCTYRCVVLPDPHLSFWQAVGFWSQCTYRCVVLPDLRRQFTELGDELVSMHLQVRGAP